MSLKKDKTGQDTEMMKALSQILGSSIREGEDLVAAAQRLVQNNRGTRAPDSGQEVLVDLTGDDDRIKSEHVDGDRVEEQADGSPTKEPGSDDETV